MAGYGIGLPVETFFDDNGLPLNNAKVYTYAAGTSTPQATYTDSALLVPNANPIRTNAAGRAVIYLPTNTAYKFDVYTSADVLVWSQDNISLVSVATPPAPSAVPTGGMIPFAGAGAVPSGYLLCDGSAVDRTVYAALFAVISTTWGIGDGATTFNLPSGVQKAFYGKAASGTGSTVGGSFGSIDHTHTGPSHTHTYSATTGAPSATVDVQLGSGTTVATSTHTHADSGTTGASGTGATGTNNPPGMVGQWVIKT